MLKKLLIKHYKGFYDEQSLEFAIPKDNLEGSGLTLIVGPNNTGKTTIIESLLLNTKKNSKNRKDIKKLLLLYQSKVPKEKPYLLTLTMDHKLN